MREGESINASAMAFDSGQRDGADILGAGRADCAQNVMKDDGRGLEAGLLWQMKATEIQDLSARGGIISELRHRRENSRRKFTPAIGKDYVDILRAWIRRTCTSFISNAEPHVY